MFEAESALALEPEEKGELKYQESKQFNGEWFLFSAYDNAKTRKVNFEIYGLDTQDMYEIGYDYAAFDGLFRFNAELMNPNRKEGRFHYIIERLVIETVNKEKKLKLMPEPTEEVPQLPIYETTRKIPTGRMDLKERQRLREQMEMLDIRRAENIRKKSEATKQRILKHIFKMKADYKKRLEEHEKRMAQARSEKYKVDEEVIRRKKEEEAKLENLRRIRQKAVELIEERTDEMHQEKYRQLRARAKIQDAEKEKVLAASRAHRARVRQEREIERKMLKKAIEEAAERREDVWVVRDERIRRRMADKIREILEWKRERLRREKLTKERNSEYLQLLHLERQPIFKAQLERTEERRQAREAEAEALAQYQEKRALPKKVKTKGKNAVKKSDLLSPSSKTPKGRTRAKSKSGAAAVAEGDDAEAEPDKIGKADTEKVLDAVEARMRAQMEAQKQRELLDVKREQRIQEAQRNREQRENEHNKQVREEFRQNVTAKEQQAAERRLIMQQHAKELQAALERKKAERERLERVRARNVEVKEQRRLAALSQAH